MEWKSNLERNALIRKMREDGHTIGEVREATGASKSVISYHFNQTVVLDEERLASRLKHVNRARARNLASASLKYKQNWDERKAIIREDAVKQWDSLKFDPSFMGFLGLYWGEGNKSTTDVGIVNNDPGVIAAAISYFLKFDPEANLSIVIRCNPDQNQKESQEFWEKALNREVSVQPKDWIGKIVRSRSPHGICTVRYSSWETRCKILAWIDCWRAELGVPDYMS